MMKRKLIPILVLALAMLACAIPNLAQPTPQPTLDPNTLATIIAGTAQMLAAQTVAAAPTMTPSATPTQTPSPTPTLVYSAQGTALMKLSDGSTQFIDTKGGYELTIPERWLPLRINEQEFFDAWSLPEATDPDVQRSLTFIQGQSPSLYRLFALDLQSEDKVSHVLPNINVVWDQTDVTTLDEELKDVKKKYPDLFDLVGELSVETLTSTQGDEFATVEMSYKTNNTSNEEITIYQKQAIYKMQTGTAIITFTMIDNVKDILASDIDLTMTSFTKSEQ